MSFILDESIGFVVYRTAQILRTEMLRRLKPFGVTPEQWSVLCCLADQDGISQRELADRTYKDGPTTTRILDKLMELGLVRRVACETDRRSFLIDITDSGRELRDQILPISTELNACAGRGMSADNKARLLSLLNQIQENIAG